MHALLVQHEKYTTCLPQEIHSCISLLPLRTLATSLFLDYARFFFFIPPSQESIFGIEKYFGFEIMDRRHVSQ